MFQYTAPAAGAPQFHTEQGYWAFAGISKTMTLTIPSGGNGKSFSAFILPQTVATASHFFRVSNTGTGRSSYYALPSDNYTLQAGHQYNCVLMQNMYNGNRREVNVPDPNATSTAKVVVMADPQDKSHVGASIPGLVTKVSVKPGDKVEENQVLAVIEAMKMETSVVARMAGVIDEVFIAEGDTAIPL